jgi:hypothetical protein
MRRMVYLSFVCFVFWALATVCMMLRLSNIQMENASFWNAACLVGLLLFGFPAFFLTFLLLAGWQIAFVAWVWKSEAFPVRIVRQRSVQTGRKRDRGVEPEPPPTPSSGHRWLG